MTFVLNAGTDLASGVGPITCPGVPVNGVSEIQSLTGTATGGQIALVFGVFRSALLPYNASAAQIQAALVALPAIGNNAAGLPNVVCAGGALGTAPVTVTFQNDLSGYAVPALTVDNTLATGGTVTPAVTTAAVVGSYRGAPVGCLLCDTVNGELYINKGTREQPTWTKIGP